MHGRASTISFLALSLTACTSVADLDSPLTKLKGATDSAKTRLAADQAEVDMYRLAVAVQEATKPNALPIKWAVGECGGGEPRCRLLVSDGEVDWPLTNRAIEHGVLDVMDGLVQYAANLNKIATANTVGEVSAALGQTKASIIAFANAEDEFRKSAGMPPSDLKPVVTAYAGPVIEIVSFATTRYVEQRKMTAIRAAVRAMQPVMDDAVLVFNAVALEAARIRETEISIRFHAADAAFRRDHTDRAKLAALGTLADTYDQFLQVKDTKVFTGLANAHAALATALGQRNLTFDEMWTQLKQVADETAKFAKLLQQLQDAHP